MKEQGWLKDASKEEALKAARIRGQQLAYLKAKAVGEGALIAQQQSFNDAAYSYYARKAAIFVEGLTEPEFMKAFWEGVKEVHG